MPNRTMLQQQLKTLEQLSSIASKEDLVECARLIALNLAQYESKYGVLPMDELRSHGSDTPPAELPLELVINGMETLILVLSGVIKGFEPTTCH